MTLNIPEIIRLRIKNFQFTNLHFDTIGIALAVAFWMKQNQGGLAIGLQGFALTTLTDRVCMALGGVSMGGKRVDYLAVKQGAKSAFLEETVFYNQNLDTKKGVFWSCARLLISSGITISAIRALRHPHDLKAQDGIDSGLGLLCAVGREFVIQKCSNENRLLFTKIFNIIFFGLIEAGKMPNVFLYKFLSACAFRYICSSFAMMGIWSESRTNYTPPLVTHLLFNFSRSFSH